MSEKIWYFAQGDTEQGPLTESRIRSLASSGTLRRDDLVWREGMKQWVPARDVPELFQADQDEGATSSDLPIPVQPRQPRQPRHTHRRPIELFGHAKVVGQPLMIVGLILVILARGCDSIHSRYVERVQAIAKVAEVQFDDSWESKKKAARKDLTSMQNKKSRTAGDNQSIQQLSKKLTDINAEYAKKRNELTQGKWRQQTIAARDADASYKMWGWWRESIFVFGTLGLTIGLLAVGFSGSGAERWICLIMIAIITFSIYVGGLAWLARIPRP